MNKDNLTLSVNSNAAVFMTFSDQDISDIRIRSKHPNPDPNPLLYTTYFLINI